MCNELSEGRIAIIAVGESRVFSHLHTIASSLRVPFIFIKWNSLAEEDLLVHKLNELVHEDDDFDSDENNNQINLHPTASEYLKAIVDLIAYYKWQNVLVLYHEERGFDHIIELVDLPRRWPTKLDVRLRGLSTDVDSWIYLLKDVKLSGFSQIIVDVQTKYLNKFLQQVINYNFIYLLKLYLSHPFFIQIK